MGIIVVIVIGVGIAFGVLATLDGQVHINTSFLLFGALVAGVAVVAGGIFSRDHNSDRAINGQIESELQNFCDRRTRMIYNVMAGKATDADIEAINAEEEAYRATIEYGVIMDGHENYYSYKKGAR